MCDWYGAYVYVEGRLAEVSLHPDTHEDNIFVSCCDIVRKVEGARTCDEVRRRLAEIVDGDDDAGELPWTAEEEEPHYRRSMLEDEYTIDVDERVMYAGPRKGEPDPDPRRPRVTSAAQYLLLYESGLCGDDPWLAGAVISFDALAQVRDVVAALAHPRT